MKGKNLGNRYGLLGKNISYSFSKGYFTQKFNDLELSDHSYENFDLDSIDDFKKVIEDDPQIKGLNVTIPYKEEVIPFLDELDNTAAQIGAVNTIKVSTDHLIGFNTDAIGFEKSLVSHLEPYHTKALVLGTGGASKAIAYVLEKLNIDFRFVSRNANKGQFSYHDLNEKIIRGHTLIVNCTPLGTHPEVEKYPTLPYRFLGDKHLLYDLIYNPSKTSFLIKGEERGASIVNGLKMLELQAEASWEIWNS